MGNGAQIQQRVLARARRLAEYAPGLHAPVCLPLHAALIVQRVLDLAQRSGDDRCGDPGLVPALVRDYARRAMIELWPETERWLA